MTVYINEDGWIVGRIQGTEDVVALNCPDGCRALDDPPEDSMVYVSGEWVGVPPRPTLYHEFNVKLWVWQDTRSMEQLKQHAWQRIKDSRDALINNGFAYAGNLYDSDSVSRSNIIAATLSSVDQVWVTQDNKEVELTAEEMRGLCAAMQAHVSDAHTRGRVARDAIDTATTYDAVMAITL